MPRKTHPNTRRNRNRQPIIAMQKVTTPEGYARQLVSKGLASIRILDNPTGYLMQAKREG